MRQLTRPPTASRAQGPRQQRGLTLVELMVAFAITALLGMVAAPYFADYGTNSRLRESGNTLFTETLFAQSEAIKRNRVVRVATATAAGVATITVSDLSNPALPVVLRTRTLSHGVTTQTGVVDFGSQGWPSNLNAVSIDISHALATCSDDYRCPGLRVEAGGAIRLCGNKLVSCT